MNFCFIGSFLRVISSLGRKFDLIMSYSMCDVWYSNQHNYWLPRILPKQWPTLISPSKNCCITQKLRSTRSFQEERWPTFRLIAVLLTFGQPQNNSANCCTASAIVRLSSRLESEDMGYTKIYKLLTILWQQRFKDTSIRNQRMSDLVLIITICVRFRQIVPGLGQ